FQGIVLGNAEVAPTKVRRGIQKRADPVVIFAVLPVVTDEYFVGSKGRHGASSTVSSPIHAAIGHAWKGMRVPTRIAGSECMAANLARRWKLRRINFGMLPAKLAKPVLRRSSTHFRSFRARGKSGHGTVCRPNS